MATWRGVTLDDRSAAMMDEVAALVTPYVQPTQGSYSGSVGASAGTHDGGGAIDIAGEPLTQAEREEVCNAARSVGWAMWIRSPDQGNWPWHLHGIAVQPGGKWDQGVLSSGAHDQVVDYYEGRNGLASGAPDDGPRDYVGTTWETYSESHPKDWLDMATQAEVQQAVNDGCIGVFRSPEAQQIIRDQVDLILRQQFNHQSPDGPDGECWVRVVQANNESLVQAGLVG